MSVRISTVPSLPNSQSTLWNVSALALFPDAVAAFLILCVNLPFCAAVFGSKKLRQQKEFLVIVAGSHLHRSLPDCRRLTSPWPSHILSLESTV